MNLNKLLFILLTICSCNNIDINQSDKENIKMIDLLLIKAENENQIDSQVVLNEAESLANNISDINKKIDFFDEISKIYFSKKLYPRYRSLIDEIIEINTNIKDSVGIAKGILNIGYYHYQIDQNDSAYYYFSKAEKIFRKVKPQSLLHGRTLINMGRVQRKFKDYVGSESNTIEAIKCFERANDRHFLRISYNSLGISERALGRYDVAIGYYQKSGEYLDKGEKGKYQIALLNNNIGNVLREKRDYGKAVNYYDKALSYDSLKIKYTKIYAKVLANKAYARFLDKDTINIEKAFLEALHIRKQKNDKGGIVNSDLNLAELYQERNKIDKAYTYALDAREKAEQLNQKEDILKSLLMLSEVAPEEEGLEYAHQYIDFSNELQKQERISRDKFARIRYETDRIVDENKKISRNNEILGISILAISALFLFIYIIFKQKQSNKELEFAKSQQESNEEIYRLMLSQQNKLEEGRQMEQKRMSEELHDGVLGRLFGVRLSLDGLNQQHGTENNFVEVRHKYIAELKAIEKEIRLISHDLGTDTLITDVAFIDVIKNFIMEQCQIHQLEHKFRSDIDIDWEEIPDDKKVNLFRIIQESLQNIFKHAKAKSIAVNFVQDNENIILTIVDDGIGFKSNKVKKGIGIKNITSRVEQMDGSVEFLSNLGTGTKVSISVPV